MVVFQNSKNFKIGERVRCHIHGDISNLVEGEIIYIHATNGWLTIMADTSIFVSPRSKRRIISKKISTSYAFSAPFYCTYRIGEQPVKEPIIISGDDAIKYVRPPRRRSVVRNTFDAALAELLSE